MRKAIVIIGALLLFVVGSFSQELLLGEKVFPLSDHADFSGGVSPYVPMDSLNVRRVGRALFEPLGAIYCADGSCYLNSGVDLVLVDVSDPENPHVKAYTPVAEPKTAYDIYADGSRVYIAKDTQGLWIVERVGDEELAVVGSYANGKSIRDVLVREGIAYVSSDFDVLLLDVSDPMNIAVLGSHTFDSSPVDLFLSDSLCFVADYFGGLRVLNVKDPSQPAEVGYYDTEERTRGVSVQNDVAYITVSNELRVLDAHNPQELTLLGSLQVQETSFDNIAVNGSYAYLREWAVGGMYVVDVSDPQDMRVVGQNTETTFDSHLLFPRLYLPGERGLRIMDVTDPAQLVEVGFMDGNHFIIDVVVGGDYSYLSDGADGLYILNTSSPTLPVVVSRDSTSTVSDVDIEGEYAYLACSTSQLRVLDVSDPLNPRQVSSIAVGNAVSVDVVDTLAYVASGNGVHIVNAADIDSLHEVGFLQVDFLKQIVVSGTYAYLACGFDGMKIIDISDPSMPAEISRMEARDWTTGVDVSGNYAYMADGYAGVRTINVSDPSHPVEIAYSLAGYGDQLQVAEPYLYLSGDYSGLRIFDISVPDSIREVGYYTGITTDGIFYDGSYIYVGTSLEGFYIFEFIPTSIRRGDKPASDIPRSFALHQNYPNPFNPTTKISFEVPGNRGEKTNVSLTVYDIRGRRVRTLIDSPLEPGNHHVEWDGENEKGQSVSSGIYLYTLKTGGVVMSRKMVMIE